MRKIMVILLVLCLCSSLCACDSADYKEAQQSYEAGDYEDACEMFINLGDYEDSATMVKKCEYNIACELLEAGNYRSAVEYFKKSGEIANEKYTYACGMVAFDDAQYHEAYELLRSVQDCFPDAVDSINACLLMQAETKFWSGYLNEANSIYNKLPQGFTYNNVNVDDRIAFLSEHDDILAFCGKWLASYITLDCEQTKNFPKKKLNWNDAYDFPKGQPAYYISMNFIPNQDLTGWIMKGECTFPAYIMGYSWPTANTKTVAIEQSFSQYRVGLDLYTHFSIYSTENDYRFVLDYLYYDIVSSNEKIRYETNATYTIKTESY